MASAHPLELTSLWHSNTEVQPDRYVAFRGAFELVESAEVEFHTLGASWFVVWLDGAPLTEGPARFDVGYPEYATVRTNLAAGRHVLSVQVHYLGVSNRILENIAPFLSCAARARGEEIEIAWKAQPLEAYAPRKRRINAQLGWIEWCDTRQLPLWQSTDFDDSAWTTPVPVTRDLGAVTPLLTGEVQSFSLEGAPTAEGHLTETFGYESDDPAARFFLRDLAPALPPQGVWRRYDLGRIRLMRPRLVLDLPPGTVVEFAYCEELQHSRVSPWITLSTSDSCNMDHYVARGGKQEFCPLTPKGGRFVEVHVIAPPDEVRFLCEEFIERCYHGEPQGAFSCDDELLNRIWHVGVETHRACSEDTLVDNPTRERGQWTGDVVTVGMDIAAAAFADLRQCRRGLVQCAQSARADGLVSGMCPGQDMFLSTYAAQWVTACLRYWELTGETRILDELFESAAANLAAFEVALTPHGLDVSLGWGFVDWGYVPNPGESDMGVNLHYLAALRDMVRWCEQLNKPEKQHYSDLATTVTALLTRYFEDQFANDDSWENIGYHRAALGLKLGFFSDAREREAVAFLKAHMLRCFPNDNSAPRLSDPGANNPRLITPYFAHFALPVLIESGEIEFVLNQYRKCWGWALQDGRTTWLEVFDPRWSHCHQWSGCPTWQLSRYLLGLTPRQDLGANHFELSFVPSSLTHASGALPIYGTDHCVRVEWQKGDGGVCYRIESPMTLTIHVGGGETRVVQTDEGLELLL